MPPKMSCDVWVPAALTNRETELVANYWRTRRAKARYRPDPAAVFVVLFEGRNNHWQVCDPNLTESMRLSREALEAENALADYVAFGPLQTPDGIFDLDDDDFLIYTPDKVRRLEWSPN